MNPYTQRVNAERFARQAPEVKKAMQEILDELDRYSLSAFRQHWRDADTKAREWRRQAANRYDPATRQWEQRT